MDREQFMEDIFMAFSITFPVANEKCKKISEKQLLESLGTLCVSLSLSLSLSLPLSFYLCYLMIFE